MANFKEKLIRFMYGRYGIDKLYYGLFGLYFFLLLCRALVGWPLFTLLMTADLVWMIYRVFSRNHAARRRENDAFLRLWNPICDWGKLMINRMREFRTHVYHKCPHCKAVLRLPRRRGQHTVRCPRCHDSFSMRVFFGGK